MNDIFARLTPIFQDVFDNDEIIVTSTLSAANVDEWDSLSHIRLMVAIEEEFKIHFTTAEITSFKNVGELVVSIQSK